MFLLVFTLQLLVGNLRKRGTIAIGAYWGGGFIREGDVLDKDAL